MAELLLEIVEGDGAGKQVSLDGPVDIGRDPSLNMALGDEQASRRHARVSPQQGGAAVVEDLGSTNGTFVNEQALTGPQNANPGDKIRVGLTVIELRSQAQVAARPSAVNAVPQITSLGQGVLQPAADQDLSPVIAMGEAKPREELDPQAELGQFQPATADAFAALQSAPGYVPPEVVNDEDAVSDYLAVARLVDTHQKRQTNVAAFAMLAAAGIAVLIYFGLT
jgi:pSer/pThr/pTyr-binding forkhead associated (FHA) protein